MKSSAAKIHISLILKELKLNYVLEHKFSERRFKADYALIEEKIIIEYEGLFSKKSRHTTATGYTGDTEKYNLAVIEGWRVLRYTTLNYRNIKNDLCLILNIPNPQKTFKVYGTGEVIKLG